MKICREIQGTVRLERGSKEAWITYPSKKGNLRLAYFISNNNLSSV